jgi:hypothetical protein
MEVMVDAAVTVNVTVAVLVVSAVAVAVTVAVVFVDTAAAVNSPVELLIVPAAAGVAAHVTATLLEPVTVAPNWIVSPEPTEVGTGLGSVMATAIGSVTVSVAPVKLHPVAPLGAVHPEPEIVALPAPAPVSVLPEIVTTPDGGLAEKLPLAHPEGAEAVLVPPTTMVVGLSVTAPVGQLGGGGVVFPPPPPQEEMNPAAATSKDSIKNGFLFMGKSPHFDSKVPSFWVRFAQDKNTTSFVFNDFLASFPLFLCFLRRSILPATRPARFFLSASTHRALPCDKSSIMR